MKKQVIAVSFLALLSGAAMAQGNAQGPWMVRARAVHLSSTNGDSTPLSLSINNKWLPEADISYFFSPNVAAELVLTVPQGQTLRSNGAAIGSFRHLPPSLTLQYHFPQASFTPYVGAGFNYTRISSVSLPAGVDMKRNSFGAVLQAGVDIPVAKNTYLNFDIKKEYISTEVSSAGARIGTFRIDPVLFGVGLGWRF
ncbi:MAG: OmpW family outer membrane protein [Pseudomonadota bacterium]